MLRWSIPLFRIRGIRLSLHWSFLALIAFFAYSGWADEESGGWVGLLWSVAFLFSIFSCVLLHELGHSFTAMAYGIGVRRIWFTALGGIADMEAIPREPQREILMTLAGPAVNFFIAGLLWLVFRLPPGWSPTYFDYPANTTGFFQLLLHWNLLMGCFNLLPVFPMDGGRIFRALLATRLPYGRATFWAATVGKVLAVAGILVVVCWAHTYLTAVLFAFIFFAGETEYRLVRRREQEAEHWQQWHLRQMRPTEGEDFRPAEIPRSSA